MIWFKSTKSSKSIFSSSKFISCSSIILFFLFSFIFISFLFLFIFWLSSSSKKLSLNKFISSSVKRNEFVFSLYSLFSLLFFFILFTSFLFSSFSFSLFFLLSFSSPKKKSFISNFPSSWEFSFPSIFSSFKQFSSSLFSFSSFLSNPKNS